jgi:8-oxo-dGTP diphosphatase
VSELPHFTDYDTRLASYAVILRERDGATEVLLALWNDGAGGRWTLPGGGVELAETVEEGCVREVLEETGYRVGLTGLLGIETDVIPAERRLGEHAGPRPMKAVRVLFRARILGGELTNEVDGTTDEARWFTLPDVASLTRVAMVDVAVRLARG